MVFITSAFTRMLTKASMMKSLTEDSEDKYPYNINGSHPVITGI
jgi:phosphoribosylformylglycinamidine (FGAM) synthase-like amidotransferase family enzyme